MEEKKMNNEIEIDLVPILKAIVSKIWLMVLIGLILAGIAFGATTVLIKPTYRCSFTAYVNNQSGKESLTQQDINAGKQLVSTYVNIIHSNTILNAAAEAADLDYTYAQLKDMVSADIVDETEIINVHVEHTDPQTAYVLANAIANTAPSYMSEIIEGSSMKVVDFPMYSDQRYKPNYIRYSLLGFAVGVLLVMIIVIIRFFRDDTVKSEGELEPRFGFPILGVIPDVSSAGKVHKYGSYYRDNSSD